MCGFIIQQKKNTSFNLNTFVFKKASKLIFHRGPDSKNYLLNKNTNVFHSRLKINLNERSNQPMTRKGYTIIFNGEIYNFKELRKQLQKNSNLKPPQTLRFYYFHIWNEKKKCSIKLLVCFLLLF